MRIEFAHSLPIQLDVDDAADGLDGKGVADFDFADDIVGVTGVAAALPTTRAEHLKVEIGVHCTSE